MPETMPPAEPMQVRLPLVRSVQHGARTLLQVIGSTQVVTGSVNGLYIGPEGFVASPDTAQDFRGAGGSGPSDTQIAAAVAAYLGANPPAAGKSAYQVALDAGFQGTAAQWLASLRGPAGVSLLGTVTLTETALVAIVAGFRTLTLDLPGAVVGDALIATPRTLSTGYAVHNAWCPAANRIAVRLSVPTIAIGARYEIETRIHRLS